MLAIIADDLSGAGDSGLQFAKRGLRTVAVTRSRQSRVDADVVVFDTDSRSSSLPEAGERVAAAVALARSWGASTIYKKIDSTMRGNVGAEIDALVTAGGYDLAVVCPSFPATGRTVLWGRLLVRGRPLADTEFASDPVWPATESLAYAVVGRQSRLHIAAVSVEGVRGDRGGLTPWLTRDAAAGVRIAVVDAETREDLDAIARAVAASEGRWVAVGSAGLAEAMADVMGQDLRLRAEGGAARWSEVTPPLQPGALATTVSPALVVVGSMNPRSARQASLLARSGRAEMVAISPNGLHDAAACLRAEQDLTSALVDGRSAFLWLDGGDSDVIEWRRSAYAGVEPSAASRDLIGRLAGIAARAAEEALPGGVVATGGDTALALCDRLGCTGIDVLGEVRPAIPVGAMLDGALAGRHIITKAGGFGDDEALVAAVTTIERPE